MTLKKPEAMNPDLRSEASLGFFISNPLIIGVDEVGRGCLAGPVVAGAAALSPEALLRAGFSVNGERPRSGAQAILLARDSKLIPEKDRVPLAARLGAEVLGFSIAEASVREIGELNILYASHLAMERAVFSLEERLGRKADAILVDGNLVPKALRDRGHALIKGDRKSITIACASIFAKVHRDALMDRLEREFPGYGLSKHKGYPTPGHKARIREIGPAEIHRMGFKGVGIHE